MCLSTFRCPEKGTIRTASSQPGLHLDLAQCCLPGGFASLDRAGDLAPFARQGSVAAQKENLVGVTRFAHDDGADGKRF